MCMVHMTDRRKENELQNDDKKELGCFKIP